MDRFKIPADSPSVARRAVEWRLDAPVAAGLFLGFLLLFHSLAQDTVYGDGDQMLREFEHSGEDLRVWMHVLHLPAARVLRGLGVGDTAFETLRAVSVLSGAAAAALAYVLARGFGCSRVAATAGSLLLALSPAWVFYSTTIEVHPLHAACFALAACAVVLAPWRRPWLAAALSALALPLVSLSHQSGPILGAGLLAMVQVGRERRGLPPLGWRALCMGVGSLYLAVLAGAFAWGAVLGGNTVGHQVAANVQQVAFFHESSELETFAALWLEPFYVLLPLVLVACACAWIGRWPAIAIGATVLPSLAFFTAWGVPERGGYALPSAVALAVGVGIFFDRVPERRLAVRAAGVLAGVHLLLGLAWIRSYDGPASDDVTRVRTEVCRGALGERFVLYSLNFRFQPVDGAPDAREVNFYPDLLRAAVDGTRPERFAEEVVARIAADVACAGGSVGLDLSYREILLRRRSEWIVYMDALVALLEERYWLQRVEHPRWPLVRIRVHPGDVAAACDGTE
jgi:hypothetical protein